MNLHRMLEFTGGSCGVDRMVHVFIHV